MNLRMMELLAPPETAQQAREVVEEENVLGIWTDTLEDDRAVLRVLVDVEQTENISDTLSEKFGHSDGFRIIFTSVEATLPQPDIDEEEDQTDEASESSGRISREELYSKISEGSELNPTYLAMVVLSTLVAGIGLILDDVATIIGAMVIAPLLAPNVSLALAVTLGDIDLGWSSLKANASGLGLSLALAIVMGFIFTVDPSAEQMISRTMVDLKHIIIALAAGSAGVLAYTRGVPAAIVGVMVAVALLPPLVDVGLLLGAGYMQLAIGAAILTVTNLICVNLAGVATFLIRGVRPHSWWEEKKAKKASKIALTTWFILLLIFAFIIWYWGQFKVEAMM